MRTSSSFSSGHLVQIGCFGWRIDVDPLAVRFLLGGAVEPADGLAA